jgi:hypothetical protein
MNDLLALPIILVGILEPAPDRQQPPFPANFATFDTVEGCRAELADTLHLYRQEWPQAVLWCAAPTNKGDGHG